VNDGVHRYNALPLCAHDYAHGHVLRDIIQQSGGYGPLVCASMTRKALHGLRRSFDVHDVHVHAYGHGHNVSHLNVHAHVYDRESDLCGRDAADGHGDYDHDEDDRVHCRGYDRDGGCYGQLVSCGRAPSPCALALPAAPGRLDSTFPQISQFSSANQSSYWVKIYS
jgi:hypothetical protein